MRAQRRTSAGSGLLSRLGNHSVIGSEGIPQRLVGLGRIGEDFHEYLPIFFLEHQPLVVGVLPCEHGRTSFVFPYANQHPRPQDHMPMSLAKQ